MNRYTILFVYLLTIRGLKGQFMTADIRGPILLGNAKSFNGKGTSVVNIVNGYKVDKDHSLNSKDPVVTAHDKEPAVITDLGDGDTNSLSAVNVIDNYDKDRSLNHKDLKETVINGGVSSDKADDYSVVKHLYYQNAKDGDDDTDIDIEDEENEDY